MLSTLILTTALALSAGFVGHAATTAADCDAHTPSTDRDVNAEWQSAEMGNPHSVDYRNRPNASHSPTNDEIYAAEMGNPESPNYKSEQPARSTDRNVNAEWQAAETGNPHSVDYRNHTISSHSPTNDEINAAERGNPESTSYKSGQPALSTDRSASAQSQALNCLGTDAS